MSTYTSNISFHNETWFKKLSQIPTGLAKFVAKFDWNKAEDVYIYINHIEFYNLYIDFDPKIRLKSMTLCVTLALIFFSTI